MWVSRVVAICFELLVLAIVMPNLRPASIGTRHGIVDKPHSQIAMDASFYLAIVTLPVLLIFFGGRLSKILGWALLIGVVLVAFGK